MNTVTHARSQDDAPVVKLNNKADAQALRHGFPVVFSNEIAMDRRTRKIAPGQICSLHDKTDAYVATVAFNAGSKIAARLLARDRAIKIDDDWFEQRISQAFALRARIFDAPYFRLVHSEADGISGLIVDRYGDTCVVQMNAAWLEPFTDVIAETLRKLTRAKTILNNASSRMRRAEGLHAQSGVLAGDMPRAPVEVPMNGATYMADLVDGQKTGLFYDQRPNHAFTTHFAKDARVLDLFSHVGGFSLSALANGAKHALAVDSSARALELAELGAARSGVSARFETQKSDVFDMLEALQDQGREFDIVVCDPPAFAPTKAALGAGLRAYQRTARLAAPLVANGGLLVLCSCSRAAELPKFRAACSRGIGRAGREARLVHTGFASPDHPEHPVLNAGSYLKALFYVL